MSRSRNPPPRGQGAARAKQMGLLLDLTPDGGMDDDVNEEDLEDELHNLMGRGGGPQRKKRENKAPVAMADIERMAALCMKDLDEEDMEDEDLADDEDLLAELNEVLEDDEEHSSAQTPQPSRVSVTTGSFPPANSTGATGLECRVLERMEMYKVAISNATAYGETSKARRYDRGLKTLQSMLTSVRKGKPVNEEEMPPPVAVGGKASAATESESMKEKQMPEPVLIPYPPVNQKPSLEAERAAPNTKPLQLAPPYNPAAAITTGTPMISPLTPCQSGTQHSEVKQAVLSRQREYKLAAIQAKQSGNIDLAKQHYVIAKKLDSVVEAIDRSEPVDLSLLPPAPGDIVDETHAAPSPKQQTTAAPTTTQEPPAGLPAPNSLAEALQQRMDIYKSAADGAKSKGDDRKARMHQRIVKQYQDSIKAHKAGRPVNLSDLPVPPGCPPLQGSESDSQNFMGVLETAMKIANRDPDAEEEEDSPRETAKTSVRPPAQKAKSPAPQAPGGSTTQKLGAKAQQQVDFLLLRRQAFLRAALHSKKMKNMAAAAQNLRHAKGLDPMIEAAKSGLPIDITKIPSLPISEDDFLLARSRTSPLSPRTSEQYHGLMDLLRKQHEKCLSHSQQFTLMGNIGEALKYEKLVEDSFKNLEILKNSYTKGQPVPRCHTEEKTFSVVKTYPNLTPNDMILYIIRGINLPVPSGVSPNDLDASVKFEFPFPSVEDAQRDKTNTIKSTSSPEFKEQFKLNINRAHRGFKRVIQSKGFKFEIIHRGGLFKTDKIVGTAQLKLEGLENHCDIREIIEVMDGRKATGGKLEVRVKIREPISGVELQPTTEKWLILEPVSPLSPPERQKERAPSPRSKTKHELSNRSSRSSSSPPQYKLHSFSLLNYDKERLERKIAEYKKNRRDPPSDVIHQHKEITHRLQWQKAQLERASPALLSEYENVLRRFTQGLADSVKKFSSQGNREAAKDALSRLKMVETELESLKRKRAG
ncbi:coiled-coil and C2 domain-containing protein 1A [Hippocampus comes]|uniref:Coiled-coil and C2 domain-containing protein 1B n=1 Tax=Hippocampus comes TaxID=109280 RepID=A0A3Q3DGU1_HIPCM|nr:PREDICTED: coiled-coil and C2 domain-containing protein 1A [Hippocampus comes]XP_019744699.1 PREDICTED: coiled-coil and C2 domain-containing protein 1A [Hippocampus comes]XP_019744700.1 PREDICTED: coiled-coil and C2 domain-containing protein 1A [Hippocampus comes]